MGREKEIELVIDIGLKIIPRPETFVGSFILQKNTNSNMKVNVLILIVRFCSHDY